MNLAFNYNYHISTGFLQSTRPQAARLKSLYGYLGFLDYDLEGMEPLQHYAAEYSSTSQLMAGDGSAELARSQKNFAATMNQCKTDKVQTPRGFWI